MPCLWLHNGGPHLRHRESLSRPASKALHSYEREMRNKDANQQPTASNSRRSSRRRSSQASLRSPGTQSQATPAHTEHPGWHVNLGSRGSTDADLARHRRAGCTRRRAAHPGLVRLLRTPQCSAFRSLSMPFIVVSLHDRVAVTRIVARTFARHSAHVEFGGDSWTRSWKWMNLSSCSGSAARLCLRWCAQHCQLLLTH